jgi:hypothetical protein
MKPSEIRERLEDFCSTWKMMIPALRENYLAEPLLNRKINLVVGETKYTLTLTGEDAFLEEGEDAFAHATFATDLQGWGEMLKGESNFLTLAMQKRMTTRMDEVLIHLRLSIMIQLLSLLRGSLSKGGD